jgi:hypothetical protein
MGGSKTTVQNSGETKTTIPQEIRDRGTKITTGAMNTYFDPAKKYQSFTASNPQASTYNAVGEATTGQLNENHDKAGQNFTAAGSSYQPYFSQGTSTAQNATNNNRAQQASGPNYSQQAIEQFQNPHTQAVTQTGLDALTRQFNIAKTGTADQAAKAGAFGNSRLGVEQGKNTESYLNASSAFLNDTLNQGFNQAQSQYNTNFNQGLATNQANNAAAGQNYGQEMGLADYLKQIGTGTQDAQINAGNAQLNFGNTVTAQQQAEKDNAYSKGYIDQRDYPMEIYERLSGMNAMQPVNRTSTTTGSSTQGTSGGWLGPALGAAGSVASMMSDERAKEDIREEDGEEALGAFSKITPKSYKYKDEVVRDYPDLAKPGRRFGFTVQDMEGAFGRPVGKEVDGYKTVDMPNMLGQLVAAVGALEKRTHRFAPKSKEA